MSKVLKDTEVLEIISAAIKDNGIDDKAQYCRFLDSLGQVVALHFGGECVGVSDPLGADSDWYGVNFKWDENVPEDGGVYEKYDTDVSIEEWQKERL